MNASEDRSPLSRRFVEWTLRRGWLLWAVALLAFIPAAWSTASLYLHLRSDLDELLPRDAPSVVAIRELRSRMDGVSYLGVIVDVGDATRLPAGERFLDDLATRIRAYPPELVRAVRTGVGAERDFVRDHAALFMETEDLRSIRERLEARRDHEVAKSLDLAIDDDPAPPIDFSDIQRKYESRDPTRGRFPDGRFSSAEQGVTLLLIQAGGVSTGTDRGGRLLARVKEDLADLGGPERYAPGMRVGYTGDVAISVEEMTGLVADLSLSSVLVFVAVIAVIVAFFRWWRGVVVLLAPLLIGTCFAFALVTLPPFSISELNSNTAFMGSIIVGNGINTGIILLARYRELRSLGAAVVDALTNAVSATRTATFSASLAAGVAYASLAVTQFRGFKQFGMVGGAGMLVCWGVTFVLVPPLVAWLDTGPIPAAKRASVMRPLAGWIARYPVPIAGAGVLLTVMAGWSLRDFELGHLEHDFSRLRRASTWSSGEGYWGRKMDRLLDRYLTPIVVLADDAEQARAIAQALAVAASGPLSDRVSGVRTIADVVPSDQQAKLTEVAAIREIMTPRMRSFVPEARRAEVDRLLGAPLVAVGPEDLPAALTTGLRERDGRHDRVVLVYPRPSRALWQGPALIDFVEQLRSITGRASQPGRPARVAGSQPLTADIVGAIGRDGPRAAMAALVGVFAVVILVFRARATTVFVLGSLLAGVVWFCAATLALGIRVNFTNFIALPITLGIGVDYAINVMARYEQDGRVDIEGAIVATGGAVGLCSVTTIIGYSSLLLADNRALFSFGVACVLGEIACLTAAVLFLSAGLRALQRLRAKPAAPMAESGGT